MRKSSRVFFFAVLTFTLVALFAIQFWLCSVSVFPGSGLLAHPEHLGVARIAVAFNLKPLLLGAMPSGLIAFAFALALRHISPEPMRPRPLAKTIVVAWLAVWVICILAIYALLTGPNPGAWSLALVTQPATLYGLVFVSLGLYAGICLAGKRARVASPLHPTGDDL